MSISEPKTSDYTQLLDYLDSLGETSTTQKEETQGSLLEEHKKTPAPVLSEEEEVRKITKKVIEKSKKGEKREIPKSSGFDVKKFESLMRSKLVDDYKKLQSYERPFISVTEIVSCIRKAYYYRLKFSVDIKDLFKFPYVDLISEVGKTIHSYVQSVYDFTEIDKTIVSDKYNVKGRIDAFKENYLYEIKTVDEDKFPNSTIPEHYEQGLIYSYIMNTEYDYNIHTVTSVYVMRNNLRTIVSFDNPVDIERAKPLLERGLILRNCLLKNNTPDVLGSTMGQCSFCEFKKYCEKEPSDSSKPYDFSRFEKLIDNVNLEKSAFLL